MRQNLLAVLVQSALLIGAALPCAYAAKDENTPQAFDIPPGTLDTVLQRFLLVADANIMYSRRDVHGLISAGAKGRLSDRQALQDILAGTGFRAIEATPSSFVLRKVEVPTN